MGQAKQRGTFQERKQRAIEREIQLAEQKTPQSSFSGLTKQVPIAGGGTGSLAITALSLALSRGDIK